MSKKIDNSRKNESGAALVTVLMVTLLLLVASAGLLVEATMNTANVTDAVSEEQAYVAAESGIQSAINVLRGNRDTFMNTNRIDTNKSATDPINLISYAKAIKLSTSNLSTDNSNKPRLSRWLQYDTAYNDRVIIGDAATYAPRTGSAFEIELTDPDRTGTLVTFNTSGNIDGNGGTKTIGSGANTVTFSYNSVSSTTFNITSDYVTTNLGNFNVTVAGTGATLTEDLRFEIVYTMTDPHEAVRVVRGYFRLPRNSSGDPVATTISPTSFNGVTLYYDSPTYVVMGSTISLTGGSSTSTPSGYQVTPTFGGNSVNCQITAAEPMRIQIKSTGYGPRGAKKELEAIIQKNFFNGMTAPATLTLVGASTGFVFEPGSSQVVEYSGDDVVSTVIIPPVGTTNNPNLDHVEYQFANTGRKADVFGVPSNVAVELPQWLWSPQYLDAAIQNLRNVAKASGRYYNGTSPPNYGDNANSRGITFVEGDHSFSGSGGGLLICTGKLTLHGGVDFNGLIIVTGSGGMDRRGGGNGLIQGNVVVAPYNPANLNQAFLPPKYDMSGGGNSTLRYNSSSVANGMTAVSNFVLGVAEK